MTNRPSLFATRQQIEEDERKGLIDQVEAMRRRAVLERRTTAEARLPDGVREKP